MFCTLHQNKDESLEDSENLSEPRGLGPRASSRRWISSGVCAKTRAEMSRFERPTEGFPGARVSTLTLPTTDAGVKRRIARGPGISAAGKDEMMGGGCGELEGVQTKKGAGV